MEERGQYITLLALQHQHGHLNEKTIRLSVGSVSVDVLDKFKIDCDGKYFNERLDEEIEKRRIYADSRRENGKKGGRPKKHTESIEKPYGLAYENHTINRNINRDISISNEGGVGETEVVFDLPTITTPLDLNGHEWDDEVQRFLRDRYDRHTGDSLFQILGAARSGKPGWPSNITDRKIEALDLWLSTKTQEGKSYVQNHLRQFFTQAASTDEETYIRACNESLTYNRIIVNQQKSNDESGHNISPEMQARIERTRAAISRMG